MKPGLDTTKHPCFNIHASHDCGRVHLPVAPKCNILCNFCRREYDCINESRPGVTSRVLSPLEAVHYLDKVLTLAPDTSVAGIAGPGDALANPRETLQTIDLVHRRFPHLLFCLASNGLNLPDYVDQLADLGVTHVTLTVNAVDPKVGAGIYRWIKDGNVILRGEQAAALLLDRQMRSIRALKRQGVMVKVNTIVIFGVNDHHILEVSQHMKDLGVDIQNFMPLLPVPGTPLADVPEPTGDFMKALRTKAAAWLPQMTHCRRCRADAVGKLNGCQGLSMHRILEEAPPVAPDRPYVAVASMEGVLVNQHLGMARALQIWSRTDGGYAMLEERPMPEPGSGDDRWVELCRMLHDCRAVLVSSLGDRPREFLSKAGIQAVEMNGFITEGLEAVYHNQDLSCYKRRKNGLAKGCSRQC